MALGLRVQGFGLMALGLMALAFMSFRFMGLVFMDLGFMALGFRGFPRFSSLRSGFRSGCRDLLRLVELGSCSWGMSEIAQAAGQPR